MLILAFVYAAVLLALGGTALVFRELPGAGEFAYSAFFFGGSVLICGVFSINMRRHGFSAAAFLSFLAFLSGCGKFFTLLTARPPDGGSTPALLIVAFHAALTVISLLYLAASIRAWRLSRRVVIDPA